MLPIFWFISIILAILAIIFGAITVKYRPRGKALTGIITGSISIILSILVFVSVFVALPSLQKAQRDTARKNDVSVIMSTITTYTTSTRGQLPVAAVIDTDNLSFVTRISSTGEPDLTEALYTPGFNCDGAAVSARTYSVSILLENGEVFCQNSYT